ncbi:cytochrome P450 [Streptomyces sp. NPDC000405]|uniref:cytochrome P450 n=1 Tax=Streptomyces sp. NPDC000405 TaxID=3161033 RepID=UPI00398CD4B1
MHGGPKSCAPAVEGQCDGDGRGVGAETLLSDLIWGHLDPTEQKNAACALDELWTYCNTHVDQLATAPPPLVEQAGTRPGTNVLRALLDYHAKGSRHPELTRVEVASMAVDLLISNAELTPRLIANTLHHLLATNAYTTLLPEPHTVAMAVQETLRYDPPLTGWLRVTTRDTRIADTRLPAGARLLLLLGSAARDERHPTIDPDTYNPTRTDAPPLLAFGVGIHYCPGAPLALHLARQTLTNLLHTCPHLALSLPEAGAPAYWPTNTALRSPEHLTVTW